MDLEFMFVILGAFNSVFLYSDCRPAQLTFFKIRNKTQKVKREIERERVNFLMSCNKKWVLVWIIVLFLFSIIYFIYFEISVQKPPMDERDKVNVLL